MSTPEKPRPSLDETIARIDAAIDALAAEMAAQPECRRCARQAIIGSELCAYHLQLGPREMIEDLGPNALIPEERTYVAFDEPVRTGWLARALHRLFS